MIFVAFVATVITLTLASKIKHSIGRSQSKIVVASESALFAFKVLMSQGQFTKCNNKVLLQKQIFFKHKLYNIGNIGTHLPSNRLQLRFIAGAWCLISVVIVYAYNGTLISYIYLPKYNSVVNNWEELAASKTLRIAASKGGLFAQLMLVRNIEMSKSLKYIRLYFNLCELI